MDGINQPVDWDSLASKLGMSKMWMVEKIATAFTCAEAQKEETQQLIRELREYTVIDLLLSCITTVVAASAVLSEMRSLPDFEQEHERLATDALIDAIELNDEIEYTPFFKGVKVKHVG